jgi:hypothetical protein
MDRSIAWIHLSLQNKYTALETSRLAVYVGKSSPSERSGVEDPSNKRNPLFAGQRFGGVWGR